MRINYRWSRIKLVSVVGATSLALAACGSSSGASGDGSGDSGSLHISVQTEGVTFNTIFPQIMSKLGYFKDAGLDVSVDVAKDPGTAITGLISGSLDIYNGGADGLIAVTKGADLEFVAGGANGSFFDVVTKSSIKNMNDLKGKTFAISSDTSVSTVAVENAAKAQGLGPDDIKYIVAGTSSNRYKALLVGQVDAGTLSPPYTFQAQDKGYNDLGSTDSLGAKPIVPVALTVNKEWAQSHSEALTRYMEAYQRLVNDLYNPKTYNKLVPVISEIIDVDQSLVRKTLESEFGSSAPESIVPGDLKMSMSALSDTLASYQEIGSIPESKSVDLNSLVDNSYIDKAHEKVKPTTSRGTE